jgi:hypothetical protein
MMRIKARYAGLLAIAVGLSACGTQGTRVLAPTVPVMPASGKPFEQFAADQTTCQQYANAQVAPLEAQASGRAFGGALVTTALGAGLGAAIGGGRGAAIGAAAGALGGTPPAARGASIASMGIQQQFDIYYSQCMYAKGNQVPGYGPNMYAIPPYPGPGYPPPRPY